MPQFLQTVQNCLNKMAWWIKLRSVNRTFPIEARVSVSPFTLSQGHSQRALRTYCPQISSPSAAQPHTMGKAVLAGHLQSSVQPPEGFRQERELNGQGPALEYCHASWGAQGETSNQSQSESQTSRLRRAAQRWKQVQSPQCECRPDTGSPLRNLCEGQELMSDGSEMDLPLLQKIGAGVLAPM